MKAMLGYFYYFYTGKVDSFMALSSEALRTAQESGDPISRLSPTQLRIACYAKAVREMWRTICWRELTCASASASMDGGFKRGFVGGDKL